MKILNIFLWAGQGLLAAMLIWASAMKLFAPAKKLAAMWPWTATNRKLVKLTGVLDAMAAIGLVIPFLTPYAAIGIALLMVAAITFHVSRAEAAQIGINIFVLALALFIAWGRGLFI